MTRSSYHEADLDRFPNIIFLKIKRVSLFTKTSLTEIEQK